MSRPLRIEFPGALYLVSAYGNAGNPIFLKDSDRRQFLEFLEREVVQHRWICYAYLLLDDHYQVLIETPGADLGRGMARFQAIYSQSFNRRHNRAGHLFQGRYKAVLVEKESFLLPVCRDMALTPVREGLVKRASQWPWSSYRAVAKKEEAVSWLAIDTLLKHFADADEGRRKAFRNFVNNGTEVQPIGNQIRGQIFLGGDRFLKEMAQKVANLPQEQLPRAMARPSRPTATTVIEGVCKASGLEHDAIFDRRKHPDIYRATVYLLRRGADMPLKEVAALGGVSPARVSQIQRAIEEAGGLGKVAPWTRELLHFLK